MKATETPHKARQGEFREVSEPEGGTDLPGEGLSRR